MAAQKAQSETGAGTRGLKRKGLPFLPETEGWGRWSAEWEGEGLVLEKSTGCLMISPRAPLVV